ncbi:MAG: TRAP transporter large permease subunit [Betaproteobacteria bacterium]|nr:TRAP transporter large permease subunit [Betaproteobacteria bacterium]MBK7080363.1 TRAP transporter large permease subunit [Betaproteobacteria bacterium]
MTGLVIFGLLCALMITGMPISIALGLTVLSFLFTMTQVPLESVALKLFTGIEKFEIMAIPFFILAGNFLTHGGVAKRMIRFATAMVGHLHGGLALGGVLACALFAAVSGSSPATVVAIGSILLPAMVKQGYPMKFGVGVIGTAGGLGILIPPSIVMVIYAVSTNSSIGKLFIAGIVPGLLLAALLLSVTWAVAKKRNYPRMPRASLAEMVAAFRESFWGLALVVVVIGGIYSGIFTPTEAAAMSAAYAFFVSVYVYKDLTLKQVPKVLLDSANLSAMILYIITNAVLFSFLLTSEQIPQSLAAWINDMGLSPWMFLMVVNILLLIAGNFMEPSSILLITAPILFPVAMKLGIDPIHLGILMTVNMEIGMITPPVGLNLYVASGIANMGLTEVTKACAPWILVMLLFLLLITYVPAITLWLPNLLMP